MKLMLPILAFIAIASVSGQTPGAPVAEKKSATSVARLEKIIFPRLDFGDATLREAVGYLHHKAKLLDPGGQGSLELKIEDEELGNTRITLRLDGVPLSAAVRYCALLAGCDVHKQDDAWFFVPKDTKPAAGRAIALLPKTKDCSALKQAEEIEFPKVDFEDATFREALEFLVAKSRHLDPEHKGVNIVLQSESNEGAVRVTQRSYNISLADVLCIITKKAGYEVVDDDHALIVRPKKK